MALGRENFNVTIALDSLFCYQGQDIHSVLGSGRSEPYLWTFMVKIDGEGFRQERNHLVGEAKFFFSPGSHGNIGGGIRSGETRRIPATVGRWETSLLPISISASGHELTKIPATILCCAVLMEENLTPNSAVEAAHRSVNDLVRRTVADTVASIGLAGLAADAAAEMATQASAATPITHAVAVDRVLSRRLKPIRELFTMAASGDVVITILRNLNLLGAIGTAIDADKPMGTMFAQLDATSLSRTSRDDAVKVMAELHNMPRWAYNLHGFAHAYRRLKRTPPPEGSHLEVTCATWHTRRPPPPHRSGTIEGVGGIDDGKPWWLPKGEVARLIFSNRKSFFVRRTDGRETKIVGRRHFRDGLPADYLVTAWDGDSSTNLNALPKCPDRHRHIEIWY